MDAITSLCSPTSQPITCIETHTCGEPTRIVVKGYPALSGSLMEQRALAKQQYDYIRKRIMLEPAGHADMYGAILRPNTELTESGEAHIGVLFCHSEGYSTMCGHATIALGRFLLDTHDSDVFPRRDDIHINQKTMTAQLKLHAPCGLIRITVPVTENGMKSDPSRPVSFESVPSFATGKDVTINIPRERTWPELKGRRNVDVTFCYGGAFTCLVSAYELGFSTGLQQPVNLKAFDQATRNLKAIINDDGQYAKYFKHPEHNDLSSLYTLLIVDKNLGDPAPGSHGSETGLCFFAEQQVDRSPTGSAVAARIAYASAAGAIRKGESWTYHSLVSIASGKGGFVGTVGEEILELYDPDLMVSPPIRVTVEGNAYYVGAHMFVMEEEDPLAQSGFLFDQLVDWKK